MPSDAGNAMWGTFSNLLSFLRLRFFILSLLHLFILVICLDTHTDVLVIFLSPHYRFEWSQRPAGTRSRSQLSGFYRPREQPE